MGSMKDLIAPLTDNEGNNMLHLVGTNVYKNPYRDLMTAPFRMQRELLWYKEVESITPSHCREVKNVKGQTPKELFSKNHEKLVSQSRKWIEKTVNQFTVIAALICTIGFAVAFTIPGGYNQDTGYPMFRENKLFTVFVVLDAVSFIFSSISILAFLSIIGSRSSQNDFSESLPITLMAGLGALFLSILTLLGAFSISFFILYHMLCPLLSACLLSYQPIFILGCSIQFS